MREPDVSAPCFTGDHAGCKLKKCGCLCHDEAYQEPAGLYPAVPAYKETAMDKQLKTGDVCEAVETYGSGIGAATDPDGRTFVSIRFRLGGGAMSDLFAVPPDAVDGVVADLLECKAKAKRANAARN